jgi:hypothetical protein
MHRADSRGICSARKIQPRDQYTFSLEAQIVEDSAGSQRNSDALNNSTRERVTS